jgi:hypothetical protein
MATFYVGPRPVLKGRNSNNMVNPYTSMTGKAKSSGTYSFYSLYSSDHVLDGAPDRNHVPGTGRHPGNLFLSQLLTGAVSYIHPLSGEFLNGRGERFSPKEFKGLNGAAVFQPDFGKPQAFFSEYNYNNFIFDGVPSTEIMRDAGHAQRTEEEGAPSSFGYFIPDLHQGVESTVVFAAGYGQALPVGYDNPYGKNRVKEFRGVPSAKAL